MPHPSKTWVVECYVPGVNDAAVHRATEQAAAAVRELGGADAGIAYLGALLMAVDEVVLHGFRAVDAEIVGRVSAAAGLQFERIVESVEVLPEPVIRPSHVPALEGGQP